MSNGLKVMSHASQFNEFLKFATENKDGALAKLGAMTKVSEGFVIGNSVRQISLSDKDSKLGIFHWWRSSKQEAENIQTQRLFHNSVKEIFDKLKMPIPEEVRKALGDASFRDSGSPLSARRIRAVADAVTDAVSAATKLSQSAGELSQSVDKIDDKMKNTAYQKLGTNIKETLSNFTYGGSLDIDSKSFTTYQDGKDKLKDDFTQKCGTTKVNLDTYNKGFSLLSGKVTNCKRDIAKTESQIKTNGQTNELKALLEKQKADLAAAEKNLKDFEAKNPKALVEGWQATMHKMNQKHKVAETKLEATFYKSKSMQRLYKFTIGLAEKIKAPTTAGDSDFHARVGRIAVLAYFNAHPDDLRRLVKSVPKDMMVEMGQWIAKEKQVLADKNAEEGLSQKEVAQMNLLKKAEGVAGALKALLN